MGPGPARLTAGPGQPLFSFYSDKLVRPRDLDFYVNAIFFLPCSVSAPRRPMSNADSRNKYAYTTIMATVSRPCMP